MRYGCTVNRTTSLKNLSLQQKHTNSKSGSTYARSLWCHNHNRSKIRQITNLFFYIKTCHLFHFSSLFLLFFFFFIFISLPSSVLHDTEVGKKLLIEHREFASGQKANERLSKLCFTILSCCSAMKPQFRFQLIPRPRFLSLWNYLLRFKLLQI